MRRLTVGRTALGAATLPADCCRRDDGSATEASHCDASGTQKTPRNGDVCTSLPGTAPQAPAPEGRDGHPAVYVPLHHHCPPIRRHAIPLCALTGIFGGIPSEPMHILARQADEVVEEEAAPVVVEKHEWQLPESIFGPRAKESDSRTF